MARSTAGFTRSPTPALAWLALTLALALVSTTVLPTARADSSANLTEVCVGVILPITSDRHIESLRVLDAIQLALNDVNGDATRLPGYVVHAITSWDLIDSHEFVRYGARQVYRQMTTGRCSNGTAPVAFIGDIDNLVCAQAATLTALYGVPLLSPGCRDPTFDAREQALAYPMFARTVSNLLAEADLMQSVMRDYAFGELVLWHSDSLIGSALGRAFTDTAFEMVDVPVPAADDGTEVERTLQRIVALRVRVIFIHAEETLGRLMIAAARRHGMLNGDYLFLGSSLWTYGADEANRVAFNEDERSFLQGVVGIGLPTPSAVVADAFQARLRGLTPFLYPPYNTQALVSTTWHAYDAITVLVQAIHNVSVTAGGVAPGSRDALDGQLLMAAIRGGTLAFSGVVGDSVSFLPDGGLDPTFAVTNFRDGAFRTVGSWTRLDGLTVTTPIVWPGLNAELKPVDVVPRTLLALHQSWVNAGIAVMALCFVFSLTLHYLIHVNHDHEVIKAASPMFCHIIVVGAEVCFVMSGLSAIDFGSGYCRLVPSMVAVSFSTIFGALLAKTYRIHRIFNSEGLKINAPTSAYLLTVTGLVAGYDVLLSVIFMTVDPPFLVNSPSPNDETTAFPDCGTISAPRWWAAYVAPKGVMLAFGAWLAYKVRHLNHNFNEAKYISLALYNVIILSAILMSLVLTFPGEVDTTYALKTVGCALCALVTLCILFVPKFWDIYVSKDWIDYHSNSSYISGVLVHKSSKTGNKTADGILHANAAAATGYVAGATVPGTVGAGGGSAGGTGPRHRRPAPTAKEGGGAGGGGVGGGGGSPFLHRPAKGPFARSLRGGGMGDSKTPPPPSHPLAPAHGGGAGGGQHSPKRTSTPVGAPPGWSVGGSGSGYVPVLSPPSRVGHESSILHAAAAGDAAHPLTGAARASVLRGADVYRSSPTAGTAGAATDDSTPRKQQPPLLTSGSSVGGVSAGVGLAGAPSALNSSVALTPFDASAGGARPAPLVVPRTAAAVAIASPPVASVGTTATATARASAFAPPATVAARRSVELTSTAATAAATTAAGPSGPLTTITVYRASPPPPNAPTPSVGESAASLS